MIKVSKLAEKNQYQVRYNGKCIFQSYDSIIAIRDQDQTVHLSKHWDYSKTTIKYLKIFLNIDCSTKEIRDRIERGVYLIDIDTDGNSLVK